MKMISPLPKFLFGMIFSCCLLWGHYAQSQQKPLKGYAAASYKGLNDGQYLKNWLLAGPFQITETGGEPDVKARENFFKDNLVGSLTVSSGKPLKGIPFRNKTIDWKAYSSTEDIIDLNKIYDTLDWVEAYALVEIKVDKDTQSVLALGSDDGIKVWLNGALVHSNNTPRGVTLDQDIVPVQLKSGSNQLLIKVQDLNQGWGFSARFLKASELSEQLLTVSARGDIDNIEKLIKAGADINYKNSAGASALAIAQLAGRDEVVKLLKEKGAVTTPVPSPDKLVDAVYSSLKDKLAPGAAVLVAQNGKVLYSKGFGYADIENKIAVTPSTKFRIGSITKQFTACSILKLQEEGKLNVTDKLSKYFPDFPRGDEVTLHHLLTHTSGINSYTGKSDFITKVTQPVTNEELLNYFKNDEYNFNPGEEFRYNNSGYFLLGYIIEKVSGKSYEKYLEDTFFKPLEMSSTGAHTSRLKLEKEAKGYSKENDQYTSTVNWDMSWAGGAGQLYSTVEDLYRWNEAVFNGKVINQESLKAAFTAVKLNNGEESTSRYGYGWFLGDFRGQSFIQHGGGLHGFISQLTRYPKESLTVAILTNITPTEQSLDANKLAEYYLWEKLAKQDSYSSKNVKEENVTRYTGRYNFGNGMVMIITEEGGNLFAQLSGQSKFPIFASGKGEYYWKVVEAKIKFYSGEDGNITHGQFFQGGNEIKAIRLPEEKIVKVDPLVYNEYTGNYDYGNSMVIAITTEKDKIFVQATNQPKLELLPLSTTEFTVDMMNAHVTFLREADGKINRIMVDIAGQKKEAPRLPN